MALYPKQRFEMDMRRLDLTREDGSRIYDPPDPRGDPLDILLYIEFEAETLDVNIKVHTNTYLGEHND